MAASRAFLPTPSDPGISAITVGAYVALLDADTRWPLRLIEERNLTKTLSACLFSNPADGDGFLSSSAKAPSCHRTDLAVAGFLGSQDPQVFVVRTLRSYRRLRTLLFVAVEPDEPVPLCIP